LFVTVDGASVLCHEAKENEEQAETEVQITAAVMDLTGDSDIEEGAHDEDYSSYELDDSDAVIGQYDSLVQFTHTVHVY